MPDPGKPTPPCGHPHFWRKITPFKIKKAFFYFKRADFENVFKRNIYRLIWYIALPYPAPFHAPIKHSD